MFANSLNKIKYFLATLIILTGCNSIQETAQRESASTEWVRTVTETKISSTVNTKHMAVKDNQTTQQKSGQASGIEDLFTCENKIGIPQVELLAARGEPNGTGSYEGGNFFEYSDCTYFVNPDTEKVVALAQQVHDNNYTITDIRDQLGLPMFEGFDDMEGFWTLEYEIKGKTLRFEATDKNGIVEFAWVLEKK